MLKYNVDDFSKVGMRNLSHARNQTPVAEFASYVRRQLFDSNKTQKMFNLRKMRMKILQIEM